MRPISEILGDEKMWPAELAQENEHKIFVEPTSHAKKRKVLGVRRGETVGERETCRHLLWPIPKGPPSPSLLGKTSSTTSRQFTKADEAFGRDKQL